jgi:diguanylate cyclase (GGDEF)-like protein
MPDDARGLPGRVGIRRAVLPAPLGAAEPAAPRCTAKPRVRRGSADPLVLRDTADPVATHDTADPLAPRGAPDILAPRGTTATCHAKIPGLLKPCAGPALSGGAMVCPMRLTDCAQQPRAPAPSTLPSPFPRDSAVLVRPRQASGGRQREMDGMAEPGGATKPSRPPGRGKLAAAALETLPDGVVSFGPDLRVGLVSGRAAALLGLQRTARHAQGISDLLEASPRLDREAVGALAAACLAATLPDGEPEADLRLPGAPGLRFGIRRATQGTWVLAITPEAALAGGGGIDPLTGLSDRAMFEARLAAALDRPARRRGGCAVLLVDLEGIRAVNQVLGHAVGEDLLRAAARRLQAAVRDADLVSRMAGEEFAVLQSEVADPAHAASLAARLVALLGRAYLIAGETVTITPRIGIAMAPADGTEAALLLRRAAMARHDAPNEGEGSWRRFTPEMDTRWQEARLMEAALRRAVAEGEFELHYQPQVSLPEGVLNGFEALIRWRHPERGLLAPGAFLPIAERLGLMRRIGDWVLREACHAAMRWPAGLSVAVNLAPAQFDDGRLPATVAALLAECGLAPGRLELEVTETVLLATGDAALAQLLALREAGVRIAMDDFGTGHSSLTQLRVFPFDRLKIDRSFVKDLTLGGDAPAIVRAVTGLGRSLGIAVIAEGVETEAQLRELLAEGCEAAQGYLFGRPLPEEQMLAVIGSFQAAMPA